MHIYLPKKYYFINNLDTNYINKHSSKITFIYRNYRDILPNIKNILKFRDCCRKKGSKFLISNNIKLALKLNLDGFYIPSFNKNIDHLSYSKKKSFIIVGSAHNLKEIRNKEKQGVQAIFISSIFKKNKNFLGLNKFKILINHTNRKVIALGGIKNINIKRLKLVNCVGFAGISFFE
jgi:thiamine-phosphate pyrophosphorylase